MTKAFVEGRGELYAGPRHVCNVAYALNLSDDAEADFTQTDGVLTLEGTPESIAANQEELEPYDELRLVLAEPLPDGRAELPVRIEPYAGHRPDERLQIRVLD
ncbi:MAG: hypothetical protein RRC07_17815 [Anaerolineae bacterium]|nr:hypothetical protein [Anaerolineae bacterium]